MPPDTKQNSMTRLKKKELGASSYDNEIITLHKGGHTTFPFTHKKSIPKAMKMKRQHFGIWNDIFETFGEGHKKDYKITHKNQAKDN